MGNKLGRRRQVVGEKYTRPQGLYQHRDMDYKKLRKLILDSKLAPCYPGDDEGATDFEECPICFLVPLLQNFKLCRRISRCEVKRGKRHGADGRAKGYRSKNKDATAGASR